MVFFLAYFREVPFVNIGLSWRWLKLFGSCSKEEKTKLKGYKMQYHSLPTPQIPKSNFFLQNECHLKIPIVIERTVSNRKLYPLNSREHKLQNHLNSIPNN